MFRLITVFAALAGLSGCATCERHAAACGAIASVAVVSITLSLHHHAGDRAHDLAIDDPRAPACTAQPNGSCR